MTNAAAYAVRGRESLATLLTPIRDDLDRVEEVLREELVSDDAHVNELVQHGCRLGGKRLRPALLLLAGKAIGELRPEHATLGAVVEMIHTATLIHDDVLDGALMRRRLDTVNRRYGNHASVLLGDFLFTHAFYLASTTGSTYACREIGRATNIVCEGELRQVGAAGKLTLSEGEYLSIVEAKTAELCACSALLGAHFAGADDEAARSLAHYGRALGIAFQIVDDLLDLLGDEADMGKSLGTDLDQLKLTLPLIRLRDRVGPEKGLALAEVLALPPAARRAEVRKWLTHSDGIEYARQKALAYADRAQAALAEIPPGPVRDVLAELPRFVVERRI